MAGKEIDMTTETQEQSKATERGGHDVGVDAIVSMGMHPDLQTWERACGKPLLIGSRVKIDPSCAHFEEQYDLGKVFKVVSMYVDAGGLNIGLDDGEGGDRYICEIDGYYIKDLLPAL